MDVHFTAQPIASKVVSYNIIFLFPVPIYKVKESPIDMALNGLSRQERTLLLFA